MSPGQRPDFEPMPLFLRPVVGFAMWHLSRGDSFDQIIGRMERDFRYGGLTDDERFDAARRAVDNLAATEKAQTTAANRPLVESIGKILPTASAVGIRVNAIVEHRDGRTELVSVTVNAPPDVSPQHVVDQAVAFINAGGLNATGRREYPTTVISAAVQQVIEGGLESPVLTL